MVPVLATRDPERSDLALSILEAHGIPALSDRDLVHSVGLYEPMPDGWSQVLVPAPMQAGALEVLKQHILEVDAVAEDPFRAWNGEPVSVSEPETASDVATSPSGFVRPELEEPTSERLLWGLAAVSSGGALQQLLCIGFGEEKVLRALSATWPFAEEWYRLITASFLHSGPAHFFSNAAFALVFGVSLFATHHFGATALTWMIASAAGIGLELMLTPEARVIGASAGVYGLVGLWAHGQYERSRLEALPRREILKTVGVLILLLPGALSPISSTGGRVAVMAHVGGFVAGAVLGAGLFHRRLSCFDLGSIRQRSHIATAVVFSLGFSAWTLGLCSLIFAS